MHSVLNTFRRRPRASGDPVNAGRQHALGIRSNALEYWIPAFAIAECVAAMRFHRSIAVATLALVALIISPATAQDFRGKDINLYVGSGAGGPYDAYARLLGRHLGKHLPGNPAVVVQNMPGASGRRLINFMFNVAPKDGTAIATIQRGNAFEPLMGEANFEVEKIAWIGNINNETNVCIVWHTAPVYTIEDLRTRAMVVGSSGPASTDSIYPNVLNHLHGMKFKLVEGYKSATEV